MFINFLSPDVVLLANCQTSELLEPLDILEDEDSVTTGIHVFDSYTTESLLFAGSEGLPVLKHKVAFWSSCRSLEVDTFETLNDSLVRCLGNGNLALPEDDAGMLEVDSDIVVATPRKNRALTLDLENLKKPTGAQTRERTSLRTPTFTRASGSPMGRKSSLMGSSLSPCSMRFPVNRVAAAC
ncbi:hypothetical protein LshimejAT787_0210720 [Lyophyllum shimeji]|uniref:Uncharacterized protein n=1 Tax=Lyophyllum shimeji TaxID=47721 RepID=A0A9P3PHI9_LYOSH|nr:hypothetical protein LshimejAT787_0210720 [Lyophyllum shimeji]